MTRRMAMMLATAVTAFTLVITAGALWSGTATAGSPGAQGLVASVQRSLGRDGESSPDGASAQRTLPIASPASRASTAAPAGETRETWDRNEGSD